MMGSARDGKEEPRVLQVRSFSLINIEDNRLKGEVIWLNRIFEIIPDY